MMRAPKPSSMVVVIDTALRSASTMAMWDVPFSTPSDGANRKPRFCGGSPAFARPIERSGFTSAAREWT